MTMIMDDPVSALRTHQETQQSEAWSQYLSRVHSLANGEKLAARQVDETAGLLSRIGKTVDDLNRDVNIVRQHQRSEKLARDESAARQATADAEDALRAYRDQTNAMLAQRTEGERALIRTHHEATARLARASNGRQDASAMLAEHWRLLGGIDPAIALRRRHVKIFRRDRADNETGAIYQTVNLCAIMESPEVFHDLARCEFFPLPGQSEAEFNELVTIAMQLARGEINDARFLLSCGEQGSGGETGTDTLSCPPRLIVDFDPARRDLSDKTTYPSFIPDKVFWVRAPGQSAERLREMVDELSRLYRKHPLVKK